MVQVVVQFHELRTTLHSRLPLKPPRTPHLLHYKRLAIHLGSLLLDNHTAVHRNPGVLKKQRLKEFVLIRSQYQTTLNFTSSQSFAHSSSFCVCCCIPHHSFGTYLAKSFSFRLSALPISLFFPILLRIWTVFWNWLLSRTYASLLAFGNRHFCRLLFLIFP